MRAPTPHTPEAALAPSAQTDRFVHDRLPPPEQCPALRYELPELAERYVDGKDRIFRTAPTDLAGDFVTQVCIPNRAVQLNPVGVQRGCPSCWKNGRQH